MNRSRVEQIIRSLLIEIGEDPSQERLIATPRRVADFLEIFAIQEVQPVSFQIVSENLDRGRMVVVRNLKFVSLCEHHLLPFFGQLHIGCIAHKRTCDPAFCAHVVERFAHRPQLQERLTEQIADALMQTLEPQGLGVAVEGQHMCMMMRGVEKQNSALQSSTLRGFFSTRQFGEHSLHMC